MSYQNFFAAKLYTDIGAGDNTITLDTAPTATSGRMVLEARNPTQREIIKYTGVSGNQLTGVTRGQGGTTAKSHLKNALIEMNLTSEDIQDLYDQWTAFIATNGSGWFQDSVAPVFVSGVLNSPGLYNVKLSGDKTAVLDKGMKVRIPRSGSPGTQSFAFDQSANAYAKTGTSPAGLNGISNTITVEMDVLIDGTQSSPTGCLVGRYGGTNATNVWWIQHVAGKQLEFSYGNGAGGISSVMSKRSQFYSLGGNSDRTLPHKRWAHLAIVVSNAATQAVQMYVDGIQLQTVTSATGAAAITTGSTVGLTIGSLIGATANLYKGNMANLRIWSTARTQQQIVDNAGTILTGAESGLIGYWRGNGAWTDATANANTFTPVAAGAINNSANNPFLTNEFAEIVATPTYSAPDTTIQVQFAPGVAPPVSGMGNISYSRDQKPRDFVSPFPLRYWDANGWQVTDPGYGGKRIWQKWDYTDPTSIAAGSFLSTGGINTPANPPSGLGSTIGYYGLGHLYRTHIFRGNAPFLKGNWENDTFYVWNVSGGASDAPGVDIYARYEEG